MSQLTIPMQRTRRTSFLICLFVAGCCIDNGGDCRNVNWSAPPDQYKRDIQISGGVQAPLFLVRFDRRGQCCTPGSRRALLDELSGATESGRYTDIFLISHGWNNEFKGAVENYERFLNHLQELYRHANVPPSTTYRPIFLGVVWPSAVMMNELPPPEAPPGSASTKPLGAAQWTNYVGSNPTKQDVELLADELIRRGCRSEAARLKRIALNPDRTNVNDELELAASLLPLYRDNQEEIAPRGGQIAVRPEDLVVMWRATVAEATGSVAPSGTRDGEVGNIIRSAVQAATVWMMKDRAGVIGTRGVGPLLDDLIKNSGNARIHLIGHSFGAKVCLSALCASNSRRVESVLLLQPAISAWCFAANLPNPWRRGEFLGRSGGFAEAISGRVRQPILTTFTSNDWLLTRIYPLFMRRAIDEGEPSPSGRSANVTEPDAFWALGGFGPQGVGDLAKVIDMEGPNPGSTVPRYTLNRKQKARVIACDGSPSSSNRYGLIAGHSDVWGEATGRLLISQILEGFEN